MARTTPDMVKAVLMSDYGPKTDGSLPDLAPFIRAASVLVGRVVTCATARAITLSSEELLEIETWLAAHFYSVSDRPYESTMTDRAQAKFHGKTGMGLDSSHYGQTAKMLDVSGCVEALSKQRFASAVWVGKRPDDATDYDDR